MLTYANQSNNAHTKHSNVFVKIENAIEVGYGGFFRVRHEQYLFLKTKLENIALRALPCQLLRTFLIWRN